MSGKGTQTPAYWYDGSTVPLGMRLLSPLYAAVSGLRRRLYRRGWLKRHALPVPVIVVGNITAGGTGKTPLTIALVQQLRAAGWKPGVASRGYGREQAETGRWVDADTPTALGGDEPVLIAWKTGAPVRVDADRVAAGKALVEAGCDVIVCDDGLQHYRLARDIEIEVVDAQRRYGNGRMIPAGPLREPVTQAAVLYVLRLLVADDIPLSDGILDAIKLVVPTGTFINPVFSADPAACPAVVGGNTEVSQRIVDALLDAIGICASSQATMNNFVWGNDRFQNYETICGGTGAGPGFPGCDAVQSHMTNTRMTDPEILEMRFPVRLEELSIRAGSGGAGHWPGGNGALRRLRFLDPVTVTTLCSSRLIGPFGGAGGGRGAVGENRAIWPDGRVESLAGNDRRDLPAGAAFEMLTPGGGGWGAP